MKEKQEKMINAFTGALDDLDTVLASVPDEG